MIAKQVLNRQLEFQIQEIEQYLDSSFDNINNFIDQIFIKDSLISELNNSKLELQLQLPKVPQFNLIFQSELQSNIVQEIKPLINYKTIHQVQIKQSSDQKHQQSLIQSQQSQFKQSMDPKSQFNSKPFKYHLIKHNSIKQREVCYTIAFNKDCSILAIGCKKQIKIYEFKQGLLKLIQVLNEHKDNVFTLNFMKKSNQFISGDCVGSILIWSNNINNQFNCQQKIQGHNDAIRCLILNTNEDILISSSSDETIKFWIKQNEWICQQTITNHTNWVDQLSLNDQQNQVISCGRDKQILVIEYSKQNLKWIVIQNILVEYNGRRLCFINNNQFTFQPNQGNLMHVYEMNSVTKQFTKTKDITVNQNYDDCGLFPQQFIKQKQLLVDKHHKCLNLIRKTQNDEFKVEQSIQFDDYCLYGQMSDDGEYLITWDKSSKEIQIRKYTEEE
ncbi:unnamed protein product [Paramecium pentaurelia]|uniref:WD40-repeat-containing domain n=1 Tax=Paramecium pentaurelia TaxID=43138 RepID=A0A8S1WNY4_9CILI|nr:unnamed protein product [Paramecium pentaurelia]